MTPLPQLDLSRGRGDDRGHVQAWPEEVRGEQDTRKHSATHGSLGAGWVVLAHGAHLETRVGEGRLYLLRAELVVAETAQSDRVAKVLLQGNGVAKDDERGADQENVLEDTRHGEDDGGGLSDLLQGKSAIWGVLRG